METLKFVGRSSALNRAEGSTSAYVKKDNKVLLIDCGESVCDKVIDMGLIDKNTKEVNILITHGHGDHTGSLSTLIFECYYTFKIIPNVLYPESEKIRDFLMFQGTIKDIHYRLIDSRNVNLDSMGIKIQSKEVEHCHAYRNIQSGIDIYEKPPKEKEHLYENMFRSYAYYLELEGKKIYYSGDSGEFNLDVDSLDEIYHDCSSYDIEGFPHIGLNTLVNKVKLEDRKKVYLMHFDSLELISKAKALGFNVAKLSSEDDIVIHFPRKTVKLKSTKIKSAKRIENRLD